MQQKEAVRKMFDNIAGSYDSLNHIMSLDADKSWRKTMLGKLGEGVDGRPLKRMQAPADFKRRTAELYWNYDLPEGHHTVELRWLNPAEKCRVECTRIITYHSKK